MEVKKSYTLKEVKKIFENNTQIRKANKSANAPIIKLIDIINNDSARISCEINKSGTALNRGAVVECLIKLLFNNQKSAKKSANEKRADLIKNGVKYEIKFSSGKGYAHFDPRQDLTNLIFVNQYGIYLTSGDNIILDKCGKHIKDIKLNKNVKTLLTF
jgi:hypothetical protein